MELCVAGVCPGDILRKYSKSSCRNQQQQNGVATKKDTKKYEVLFHFSIRLNACWRVCDNLWPHVLHVCIYIRVGAIFDQFYKLYLTGQYHMRPAPAIMNYVYRR